MSANSTFSLVALGWFPLLNFCIGAVLTHYWSRLNRPLVERVVEKSSITPDSKILEIGFGRGHGLELCRSIIAKGAGQVFGIEASAYMLQMANKRFVVEIVDNSLISVDAVSQLGNMPYPTNFFNAIFHVDVFYFWNTRQMFEICHEMHRILKPNGTLVCGMELNNLKRLERHGVLVGSQFDPMRYMVHLEPSGFKDVKVEYEKIGSEREIQVISARKIDDSPLEMNYDTVVKDLEMKVKEQMAIESLLRSQHHNANFVRQAKQRSAQRKNPS